MFEFYFSVNYPVIHVLRISEEATESETPLRNAKSSVKLSKPLSLKEPKSMAFVDGCDDQHPDKCRNVQLASVKLHKSNELGSDVYLMQGEECNI